MLYVIFTPPDRVKFSEYIPHILVRAPNQKKARDFAVAAYPNHPLPLVGPDAPKLTRCAPLMSLRRITVKAPLVDIYFAVEDSASESAVRQALAAIPWETPEIAAALITQDVSQVTQISPKGRSGVVARTENLTPMIVQNIEGSLLFAWRVVSNSWPNPAKDPNMVPSRFMQPEVVKAQSLKDFQEQEAELIARLIQPQ